MLKTEIDLIEFMTKLDVPFCKFKTTKLKKLVAYVRKLERVRDAAKDCLSTCDLHQSASSLTYWDKRLKEALKACAGGDSE